MKNATRKVDTGGYEPYEPNDEWLKGATEEEKVDAMRDWFLARYVEPEYETPYSSEVGYIFVDGGPYDPSDELNDRFHGLVSDDLIQTLVDELYKESGDEWAPKAHAISDFEFDEELAPDLDSSADPLSRLKERLKKLHSIANLGNDELTRTVIAQLTYSAVISALEAFLWETSDYWVMHDDEVLQHFVTRIPALRDVPMKLGEIFEQHKALRARVRGFLQNFVWHRFRKVEEILTLGLAVKCPEFEQFDDAVTKRHDIVHRSGHDKNRMPNAVSAQEATDLATKVEAFCEEISKQLAGRKSHPDLF